MFGSEEKKRVDRARKKEEKAIKWAKNRKYWVIGAIILALILGLIGGYSISHSKEQKRDYTAACQLLVDKEYRPAQVLLEGVKYKDGQEVLEYINLRLSVDDCYGKTDQLLDSLKALKGFENKGVNSQYNDFLALIEPVGSLQKEINGLDLEALTLDDQASLDELNASVKALDNKYKDLLVTKPLDDADKKMTVIKDAADKLQSLGSY